MRIENPYFRQIRTRGTLTAGQVAQRLGGRRAVAEAELDRLVAAGELVRVETLPPRYRLSAIADAVGGGPPAVAPAPIPDPAESDDDTDDAPLDVDTDDAPVDVDTDTDTDTHPEPARLEPASRPTPDAPEPPVALADPPGPAGAAPGGGLAEGLGARILASLAFAPASGNTLAAALIPGRAPATVHHVLRRLELLGEVRRDGCGKQCRWMLTGTPAVLEAPVELAAATPIHDAEPAPATVEAPVAPGPAPAVLDVAASLATEEPWAPEESTEPWAPDVAVVPTAEDRLAEAQATALWRVADEASRLVGEPGPPFEAAWQWHAWRTRVVEKLRAHDVRLVAQVARIALVEGADEALVREIVRALLPPGLTIAKVPSDVLRGLRVSDAIVAAARGEGA